MPAVDAHVCQFYQRSFGFIRAKSWLAQGDGPTEQTQPVRREHCCYACPWGLSEKVDHWDPCILCNRCLWRGGGRPQSGAALEGVLNPGGMVGQVTLNRAGSGFGITEKTMGRKMTPWVVCAPLAPYLCLSVELGPFSQGWPVPGQV